MTLAKVGRRAAKTPAIVVVGGTHSINDIIDSLTTRLRQQKYKIIAELLPSEVLGRLTQYRVPLVVCDDSAPSMRSFALMSEIKQRSPQTHVVLVVPSGSAEQERRARAAGADSYLPSNFALRKLQMLLEDVLA
jgi:DNA-binding NarL/FixJ family response regulator